VALQGQLPESVVPPPGRGDEDSNDRTRLNRPGRPSARARRRAIWVTTAWILVTLFGAGGLMAYRYHKPARIEASGDSYWYMRQALMFTGKSEPEASRISAQLICADQNRVARELHQDPNCFSYDVSWVPQRYIRIFTSRPGFPLFAVPFVATLGAWHGMLTATVVLCLIAVVLAFLAVYLATGYRLAGFVTGLALIALPSGFYMTRMLTEGGLMAGYAAVIAGALLTWRGRYRFGLTVITLSLVWLFAVKSASGLAAAAVVAGASLIGLVGPRVQRRGPLLTGALGLVAAALWAAFSGLTHQPGLNETIQDFAANHFRKPDVPDPYGWLYRKNLAYWPDQWQALRKAPKPMIGFVVASALLVVKLRREAALFVFIGLIGVAMQVAHPYASQWDRMNFSLWLTMAAAAGLVAGWAGHQATRLRRRRTPESRQR
jgi:hypothetical protein